MKKVTALALTTFFVVLLALPLAWVWMLTIGNLWHAFGWLRPISIFDTYALLLPVAVLRSFYGRKDK